MQFTSLRYSGIVSRTPIIFFIDAGTLITKQGRSEQQLFIISFIGIRFVLNARNLDPSLLYIREFWRGINNLNSPLRDKM